MSTRAPGARLTRRAKKSGVSLDIGYITKIERYLDVLRKWNRRINLTALPLDPASDETLDRLIIEPVAAARHVKKTDRLCIDIGSGGGSPGIPFHLAAPWLRVVLVEVKVRKSAFLREVIRQLDLSSIEVETRRFEELLARVDLLESADIVTIRAVRPDAALWNTVQAFLRPGGRVFWFGSGIAARAIADLPLLRETKAVPLVKPLGSRLAILTKI